MTPQDRCTDRQPARLVCRQDFLRSHRRSSEPATDPAHGLTDRFGIRVEQVFDEDVRMYRPNPERRKRGELPKRSFALVVSPTLERDQVGVSNSPVRPHLVERQLACLQQADEERSRHVQQVRRLLRRELRMVRHQCHGVALRQLGKQRPEQADRRGREDDRIVRCALEPHDARFLRGRPEQPEQPPARVRGLAYSACNSYCSHHEKRNRAGS